VVAAQCRTLGEEEEEVQTEAEEKYFNFEVVRLNGTGGLAFASLAYALLCRRLVSPVDHHSDRYTTLCVCAAASSLCFVCGMLASTVSSALAIVEPNLGPNALRHLNGKFAAYGWITAVLFTICTASLAIAMATMSALRFPSHHNTILVMGLCVFLAVVASKGLVLRVTVAALYDRLPTQLIHADPPPPWRSNKYPGWVISEGILTTHLPTITAKSALLGNFCWFALILFERLEGRSDGDAKTRVLLTLMGLGFGLSLLATCLSTGINSDVAVLGKERVGHFVAHVRWIIRSAVLFFLAQLFCFAAAMFLLGTYLQPISATLTCIFAGLLALLLTVYVTILVRRGIFAAKAMARPSHTDSLAMAPLEAIDE